MAELFHVGDRVRTSHADPQHHTRLPRYARSALRTMAERQGCHPLPDHRTRQHRLKVIENTTSSCARCARATRSRCSGQRRPGTRARRTG